MFKKQISGAPPLESSRQNLKTALLIYGADSYVGFCQVLHDYLVAQGVSVSVIEASQENNAPILTEEQRIQWGISFPDHAIERIEVANITKAITRSSADFVFLGVNGRTVFKVGKALYSHHWSAKRPIIATGFPGLQFRLAAEGVVLRCFVDRLLFVDPSLFRKSASLLSLLAVQTADCVLLGSPRLRTASAAPRSGQEKYVIFFEQNVVPQDPLMRAQLANNIIELAKAVPEKTFLLAGRSRTGEISAHQASDGASMASLVIPVGQQNIEAYLGNWLDIKDDIYAAFSVSSTAILEASILGIPSYSLDAESGQQTRFSARAFFKNLGFEITFERLAAELRSGSPRNPPTKAQNHISLLRSQSLPLVFEPLRRRTWPEAPIFLRNFFLHLATFTDRVLSQLR